MLVFTLVLSCLVDWMIELSISNKEQTRNVGNFTLYSFNTPSGRELNGLPWVQTSTQVNTFGISLGVLYVSEWPTQPCWLTCDKSWLRNGMPSHSSVWPGWWPAWGGGAKLLWLRMDLPHATEVPDSVKWIKCKNEQYVLFFSLLLWESAIIQSTKQLKTRMNTNIRIN